MDSASGAVGMQAHAAWAATTRPRLFVTPAHVLPGPRVRAVVHLRGLPPGAAVEVQVNPPAPSLGTLVDVHTRAEAAGSVDQPVAFSAVPPGAYVAFVNIGAYADPRSSIPGMSLQAPLLVTAALPFISVPCGAPLQATVSCPLTGYGFHPRERVSIVYDVSVDRAGQQPARTAYRRAAITDAQGSFTRPVFSFRVDPRVQSYRLTVTVRGSGGDHARSSTVGIAQ